MLGYIFKRVLATIPVMAFVALFVFSLLYIAPGDPAAVIAGDQATPDDVERIRASLGLDRPYLVRFGAWDQKWNSPLIGPVNPRPGTVFSYHFTVAAADKPAPAATAFLTSGGTLGAGFFDATTDTAAAADGLQTVTQAGIRNTSMACAWDQTLCLRIFGNPSVANVSPVRLIRPELALSAVEPFDLGTVKAGQPSEPSAARRVFNSQKATASADGTVWATVLYGVAQVTAPADKLYLQTSDQAGVVLVGEHAALFALGGEHAAPDRRSVQLLGSDGKPGLAGGAQPEEESFTVRFRGSDKPGLYTAAVRIVTQAGKLGVISTGKPGEPLAGLYYLDLPVSVRVE